MPAERAASGSVVSNGSIGHHVVRNNTVHRCEQAGIAGSMGAAFSEITDNHVHDINVEGRFGGAEIAGIKFHAPIDTTRTSRGSAKR